MANRVNGWSERSAMTRDPLGARPLYVALALLTVIALVGMAVMNAYVFNATERQTFAMEIGKGLVQIFTVAVIGSVIKLLIDDHQRRVRELTEARVRAEQEAAQTRLRAEQQEERLEAFRNDKVRRLVTVTNVLRRAPVLIDAHRSARTYNEQMREIVNAGLELRLIRHEIDALGPERNTAFEDWPQIREALRKMEAYIRWIVSEFRSNSKGLSELQRRAETDRSLQTAVWERIYSIRTVRDLLQDVDAAERNTRFAQDYLEPYQEALRVMIASSLSDARAVDLTQASSSREADSSRSDNELQVLPKL